MMRIMETPITGCSITVGCISGTIVDKVDISSLGIVGTGTDSTSTLWKSSSSFIDIICGIIIFY